MQIPTQRSQDENHIRPRESCTWNPAHTTETPQQRRPIAADPRILFLPLRMLVEVAGDFPLEKQTFPSDFPGGGEQTVLALFTRSR